MALYCPAPSSSLVRFEFIDCGSISISYDRRGIATVSFTIISSDGEMDGVYTDLTFGGVRFRGPITSVDVQRISKTTVYTIRVSLIGFGC
jgi:hypothetical protein